MHETDLLPPSPLSLVTLTMSAALTAPCPLPLLSVVYFPLTTASATSVSTVTVSARCVPLRYPWPRSIPPVGGGASACTMEQSVTQSKSRTATSRGSWFGQSLPFCYFLAPPSGECTEPPESPSNRVECYDFCQLQNKQQCFCSGSNECHFCCQEQVSSNMTTPPPCTVVTPTELLPDGTSCVGGLCERGECKPVTQDLVNRLFSLFTDISIDRFCESNGILYVLEYYYRD